MKITKDGFIWKIVNNRALELFTLGVLEVYVLNTDDSESLLESKEQYQEAIDKGLDFGIEVGHLPKPGKIYVNNSRLMETIDDIVEELVELKFGESGIVEDLNFDNEVLYTEEAQEYYNEKYDEIENLLELNLGIVSDNELQ